LTEQRILLNDFQRQWRIVGNDVLAATQAVGESGWYVLGKEVSGFEEALARMSSVEGVVGCASGLDAIELALRALGLRPGDRVITTPLSAFATTLAIVRSGGIPVFVDVDATGSIDLAAVEELLARDGQIRALVAVHLYGHVLDLGRLSALRARHGIVVIEDAAQAVLGRHGEACVGSAGDLTATSFYPTKNLGAFGDGGAVLGPNGAALAKVRQLRDYGQSAKNEHTELGMNSRLDELHGAILRRALLPRLTDWTERRRQIAERYVREIDHPSVRPVTPSRPPHSVWHLFPVLAHGHRAALAQHLAQSGIQTAVHYPTLIPDQGALRDTPFELAGELTRARAFANDVISLPIHPQLTDDEVTRVIAAVNAFRC